MILPTMTREELAKEILKDYESVLRKTIHLEKKLRKSSRKTKMQCLQQIFDYRSKRLNNWVVVVNVFKKKSSFNLGVHFADNEGYHAYVVSGDQKALIHYSSHFLQRYNERSVKKEGIKKVDLIKRYMSTNTFAYLKALQHDSYKHRFFARTGEGVSLGYMEYLKSTNVCHCKTFIANDMIHEGSQSRDFDLTTQAYRSYWEEAFQKTTSATFVAESV